MDDLPTPGLATYDLGYPGPSDYCPADDQFVEWYKAEGPRGGNVFHWGTGTRHYVGLSLRTLVPPCEVFGVTASVEDHAKYVNILRQQPKVGNNYKVLFCDGYCLSPRSLPRFDAAFLPGVGEYFDPTRNWYAQGGDQEMVESILKCVNRWGRVVVFIKSPGYGILREILNHWERKGVLRGDGRWEKSDLDVYTVRTAIIKEHRWTPNLKTSSP